jgi:hypothetical protein
MVSSRSGAGPRKANANDDVGMGGFTNGIRLWKCKFQAVDLVLVKRVCVEDSNIEGPFLQTVAVDELDAWW